MGDVVSHYLGRTALSKRIFTGLQPRRLGELVAELAGTWMASEESRLRERRGLRVGVLGVTVFRPFSNMSS